MEKKEGKANAIASYLMQAFIVILIIIAVYRKDYTAVLWGIIALFVTSLPLLIKRRWKVTLPLSLIFLIFLSLFLHVAGVTTNWYQAFYPFYDKFGHLIGSFTVALLGFTSVLIIDWYTHVELNDKSIIVFIIIFTVAMGAFWEIGEFASDQFLKTNSQPSLNDTMFDLIFDLVGGILASVIAVFKLKHGRKNLLQKMFEKVSKKIK